MKVDKTVVGLILFGLMLFGAGFAWGVLSARPRLVCDHEKGVCLRAVPARGGCAGKTAVRWVVE